MNQQQTNVENDNDTLRARIAELEGALREIEEKGDTEWGGADCSICASAALERRAANVALRAELKHFGDIRKLCDRVVELEGEVERLLEDIAILSLRDNSYVTESGIPYRVLDKGE